MCIPGLSQPQNPKPDKQPSVTRSYGKITLNSRNFGIYHFFRATCIMHARMPWERTPSSGAFPELQQLVMCPHNNRVVLLHLGEMEGTTLSINHVFKALLQSLMQRDEN